MSQKRVVVVGAGLAGLAAARRLETRGVAVTVLERHRQVGGRARSECVEGFPVEVGSRTLWSADASVLGLLSELGLREELISLAPRGREQLYRGVRHPVDPRDALGVARIKGVRLHHARRVTRMARLLRRFGAALHPAAPERAAPHDDRSVYDFARLYFGGTVLDRWITPFLSAAVPCDVRETSRALFLRRVLTHRDANPCSLRRGLATLPEALAAELRARLACEVTRVERSGGCLRVDTDGRDARAVHEADAVVLAVAAPAALRLADPVLEPAEREFLAATRYEAGLSVAIATAHRIDRATRWIHVPAVEGWPVETIRVEVGAPGGRVPDATSLARLHATAAFSRAHRDAPDEVVAARMGETLERVYPVARAAILFTRVYRDECAAPRFDVGRYRALARFQRVQADLRRRGRRLYFAGDYLADPSLEGALASGLRAADAVLADP